MKNQKGLERLEHVIDRSVSIPETEWEQFVQRLSERTFAKGEYLVRAGDVANNFYFIVEGLARFFYCTEDGKEFNKHFAMGVWIRRLLSFAGPARALRFLHPGARRNPDHRPAQPRIE